MRINDGANGTMPPTELVVEAIVLWRRLGSQVGQDSVGSIRAVKGLSFEVVRVAGGEGVGTASKMEA